MIEVKNLTKRYGKKTAVDHLSFIVESGEVFGFLGPNGAGKSTTMNIITGCLSSTEGTVLIDGHDIFEEPYEAKKMVGYLPEQPPLYMDMTVEEYLFFVAEAKKVKKDERPGEVERVMKKTGLMEVHNKLIKTLSKGYKQRVGIAQALLGNPRVVILDEPTVGLDPRQILEIRELIKNLGKDHTVILSSHILQEVNSVCDKIMIISHGMLKVCATPEELYQAYCGKKHLVMSARTSKERLQGFLQSFVGEKTYTQEKDVAQAQIQFETEPVYDNGTDVRDRIVEKCIEEKFPMLELYFESPTLEEVFMELTSE